MYCYKKGEFTQDFTMSQMIEFCLQFLDQWAVQTECKLSPVQAKEQMLQYFPYLKRWKEKDERTLTEKATHLLAQCENVTIASIDADGYPRPVQMSKIHAKSFNEVWMATSVGSMKVNDFKANNKAGLCYDHYGDGVALRGTVEIITDDTIRKAYGRTGSFIIFPMDQVIPIMCFYISWVRKPPFWINGEFSHSNI